MFRDRTSYLFEKPKLVCLNFGDNGKIFKIQQVNLSINLYNKGGLENISKNKITPGISAVRNYTPASSF